MLLVSTAWDCSCSVCQAYLHKNCWWQVFVWKLKFLPRWWMLQNEAQTQAQQREEGSTGPLANIKTPNATIRLLFQLQQPGCLYYKVVWYEGPQHRIYLQLQALTH